MARSQDTLEVEATIVELLYCEATRASWDGRQSGPGVVEVVGGEADDGTANEAAAAAARMAAPSART